MTVFVKDPNSTSMDYTVQWTTYLTTGETISSSTWNVSSTDMPILSMSNTTVAATVWVGGGTAGRVYLLSNKVVTSVSPARSDERTIVIRVEDR